jgi:hypothetical protein
MSALIAVRSFSVAQGVYIFNDREPIVEEAFIGDKSYLSDVSHGEGMSFTYDGE